MTAARSCPPGQHDFRPPRPAAIEDADWRETCATCGYRATVRRTWVEVAEVHLPIDSGVIQTIVDTLAAEYPDRQLVATEPADVMVIGYWRVDEL